MKLDPTSLYDEFQTYVSEDEIKEFMRSQGRQTPGIPGEEEPEIPDDLAGMPHKVVGDLLTKLTAWHGYLQNKVMVYETLAEGLQKKYDDVHAQVYLVKSGTAKDREYLTQLDPKVRGLAQVLSVAQAQAKALKSDFAILNQKYKSVSRAITLLEAESRIQSRDYNVGRRTTDRIMGRED